MLKRTLTALLAISLISSCNPPQEVERPDDAIGVGREFIEASLKGKYETAKKYLLPDSLNVMYFERMQNFYEKMSEAEKEGYRESNIIINGLEPVTDTVAILNYSNTFKKEPAKIKLVQIAKEWWVDFKYSFSGNM